MNPGARGESRPDPDALLAEVEREDTSARRRGRLKVFLGATAGVGKTYAMLEEARERASEGTDVVAGVVETHGRRETDALLQGLEVLPRRSIQYKGVPLTEFDLDGALARRPGLLLVDELAHTNAPGSRHTKRWQDVDELLAAGIDVYTTINVQHLDSLNDLVARITHVVVRETVPDSILERADEIELIDLPPDDLLQRLREGKVYVPEQARRASRAFFRKANLIALRQMALRKTAEQVDAQLRVQRRAQGVTETWPIRERLLVAVGPSPSSQMLVRAAKRMADQLGAEWVAVFVETPDYANWSETDRQRAWETLRLAERLGATTTTLSGSRPGDEILAYARTHNVSKILVGKPTHSRWRDVVFGSKLEEMVRGSGDIDVYMISGPETVSTAPAAAPPAAGRLVAGPVPLPGAYARAVGLVVLATLIAVATRSFFEIANLAMIYLLAVLIAAVRFGRGPSIAVSILSVAAFDFFCVPPYNTFAVADAEYIVTFGVMLVIALTITALTTRIQRQAEAARERERRTASLYAVSQSLVRASDVHELLSVGIASIGETFDSQATVLLPAATGELADGLRTGAGFDPDPRDRAVARWVFDHGQPAGLGTDTLPAAQALYVPLQAGGNVVGVLGVRPRQPQRLRAPEQMHLLEAFAALIAVAVDQAHHAEETRRIRQLEEMDRLKSDFVAVASHELRTPINSLTMEVELLQERLGESLPERSRMLLDASADDVRRLRALVDDLLDLSKLESGRAPLELAALPPERLIRSAADTFRIAADERQIQLVTEISPGLHPVLADMAQIERVLANLVTNAIRSTPSGGRIILAADDAGAVVQFSVADNGVGISLEDQSRIFSRFVQLEQPRHEEGTGLGLAIARGIVQAHGGEIWVDSGPGPGAVFSFTLPVAPENLPPVAERNASDEEQQDTGRR
jgi:two-component system sensor histidine kinase KdpD